MKLYQLREEEPMSTDNRELVEWVLRAFEAKDLEAALACFADDALLFDPHYPTPEMRGKAAIRGGFEFIFGIVKRPGFTIRHFWAGDHDSALEVDTHHVLGDGTEVRFPQVFVFEIGDGLFQRFQAYVPYPPPPAPAEGTASA
jgi:ketosteroid isomerase-like protein